MTISYNQQNTQHQNGIAVALHCSLGSGRQWTKLIAELGDSCRVIAPDISGYGSGPAPENPPLTLAEEVERLGTAIGGVEGPLHLVGHSYGGAIAFKIATASRFAGRVRSLTLIEPVLPTLLKESPADRRLYDLFAQLADKCRSLGRNESGSRRSLYFLLEWIRTGRAALQRGAAPHDGLRREGCL